jgi:hypothetical protein
VIVYALADKDLADRVQAVAAGETPGLPEFPDGIELGLPLRMITIPG